MVGLMNNPGSTSGFSFGQPITTSANSFSFGQSAGSSQPSQILSFGNSGQTGATVTVNPLMNSNFSFQSPNSGTQTTASGGLTLGQANAAASSSSLGGFSFAQSNPASTGGFSFSQTTTASSSVGGFSFSQTAPLSSSSVGLGTGQSNPLSSGFSLGQTNPVNLSTSTGFNLGQANPSATNPGFGFSQAAPNTSTSGVNVGLNSQSSGLFGQTSTTGLGFGQATTSSTTVSGTSTPQLLTHGQLTNPASSTGTFGQPQPTSSTGTFGQPQPTSSTGTFAQPQPTSSTGTFAQPQPTSSTVAGIFAQPQPTSSTGPGMFAQTQPSNLVSSSTSLFGLSTAGSTTGNLGQPTSSQPIFSSGSNFGLSSIPASSSGLFNQTSSTSSTPGLNFGVSAPSTAGFNLSAGITSSSSPSTSIFPSIATTSSSIQGLGGCLPSTTGGTGGQQASSVDSGIGSSFSKGEGKPIKEIILPEDTVAMFEAYKDKEKKCSEDNVRQTATPFHKLVEDTKKLRQHIVQLSNQHNQLHTSARKLKSAVIQEAENVEMGRRTQDTPMNLQGDNKAPEQFFLRLVRSFEERMTFCRNRIEEVEKCARSNGSVGEITSEDMKEVLKKEHEMVKMLAAKIYTLHNQLISYTNQATTPDMPQPEALFKRGLTEEQLLGISHKNSSILRPAMGEGGSGLLNFQNGQQRAKALSLGAAPPTMPLNQTSIPNLLGSTSQSSLFNVSSNPTFGSSLLNFNVGSNPSAGSGSSFNFNKSGFGSPSPSTGSIFGTPSLNQNQSGGIFGAPQNNNTSPFSSNAKSLKK